MKNLNCKNGFTMIELIFVIVILGILGAIAIPKLSSTRDDAKLSAFYANVKTCINDVGSNYTATGSDITNATIATFKSCSNANDYLVNSVEANSTTSILVTNATDSLNGVHNFGGTSVVY